ncbi:MAG TPA: hypothetical protein VM573_07090 [Actinomycetota bacterium]|jgi:hypothetical protein|nr:hypothetical protein [Actinomycetota bacterium]
MGWAWILYDEAGQPLRTTASFADRAAAEAWLSEHWQTLADEGAAEVGLGDDGEEVYRMGLGPA